MRHATSSLFDRRRDIQIMSAALVIGALLIPAAGRSDDTGRRRPNPPTELQVVDGSSASLSLSWKTPHGRGTDGYALFEDDKSMAAIAETSYTFTDLSCGMSYTLGVEAYDSAGSHSERVAVIAATAPCSAPTSSPTPPSLEPGPPAPSESAPSLDPPGPTVPAVPMEPDAPAVEPPLWPESPGPTLAMSWNAAGAFVWHETDVDPQILGWELRENGFGWVAVLIHDGLAVDPLQRDWMRRFREASGLPVGGWGVLRAAPEHEASLAHNLVDRYGLDFYIANAETEYKYSDASGQDVERFERSQRFVQAFRTLSPHLPAAISSYCRADRQDIDWAAWSSGGFAFLPQAYVNDFGDEASPAACADGAAEFFPAGDVHPTIGMYRGQDDQVSPERYAALLRESHTVGFSVYLAENRMQVSDWQALGHAIRDFGIAQFAREAPSQGADELTVECRLTTNVPCHAFRLF